MESTNIIINTEMNENDDNNHDLQLSVILEQQPLLQTETQTLWRHLPLLFRSNSKESLEFILQSLWRTRKTGLDASDRRIIRDSLQLETDFDLDPLLVCLRKLIRRCVYDNISKDQIPKVFPDEVLPEIQRLLTLLLQKFQSEWQNDVLKDKGSLPRLKAMTWNMANQDSEVAEPAAVINLKLQSDTQSLSREQEVKFQLPKDTLETMLKSMHSIRNQLSDIGDTPDKPVNQKTSVGDLGGLATDLWMPASDRSLVVINGCWNQNF
ncbi:hypothetical protein ACFE04_031725 [Oxalis oulophora]